jgi:hypothetical protein
MVEKVPDMRFFISLGDGKLGSDLDFLMRFEHLEKDFTVVCKKLGIRPVSLPRANRSKRKHYSKYYDKELVELVRERFQEEIELGSYQFRKR